MVASQSLSELLVTLTDKERERLKNLPVLDDVGEEEKRDKILCPTCQFEYTHLEGVNSYESGDDKRLSVELVFRCEDGHHFILDFMQHKGGTYACFVEVEKINSPVQIGP